MKSLILYLCILFCLSWSSLYGEDYVYYVNPDAEAGGDGSTPALTGGSCAKQSLSIAFSAAFAADADLVTGGDTLTIYCASEGTDDTTEFTWDGFTTSAAYDITIIGSDFPSDGIWDGTQYVLHNDSSTFAIWIKDNHITLRNIQIQMTDSGANTRHAIYITDIDAVNSTVIDSCLIKGSFTGATGTCYAVYSTDADSNLTIFNTIFTDIIGAGGTYWAFRNLDGTTNIYNCNFYGNNGGVQRTAGTVTAINCALFNNTDDWLGTVTSSYCGWQEGNNGGTGDFQITQTADDYAALVVDAGGDDFRLTNTGSQLYQSGNGATPKSVFTDDIRNIERSSVDLDWCVGAYTYGGIGIWLFEEDNKDGGKSGGKQ